MAGENNSAYGSLGGMGAGALVGTMVLPGVGTLIGAGLGGSVGGLVGGLFSKKQKSSFNIDAELAKLSALIAKQREAGQSTIESNYRANRSEIASSLAGRGTYRSPVAEASFNRLRQAKTQALVELEGNLAGMEAGARSDLMKTLMGYRVKSDELAAQRGAALAGQLGGLSSTLLMTGMRGLPAKTPPAVVSPAAAPSIAGVPQGNYISPNPSYAYNPSYGSNAYHFPDK